MRVESAARSTAPSARSPSPINGGGKASLVFRLRFYDKLPRTVVEQIFARDALHICSRDSLEFRHGFAHQFQPPLIALRAGQRAEPEIVRLDRFLQ